MLKSVGPMRFWGPVFRRGERLRVFFAVVGLAVAATSHAANLKSRLQEAPLSPSQGLGVIYGVWGGEGATQLQVTLDPVWGLTLKQAVDGNGAPLSPRRLPYGDVFTVAAEPGGRFRLMLTFAAAAGGVHEV